MQLPMPPSPLEPPGPIEQALSFCVVYLLLLSVGLLALPQKWAHRIVQIALHLRGDSRIDGEVR
jgi:hypothetical protein